MPRPAQKIQPTASGCWGRQPVRCTEEELSCRRIRQDFSLKRFSKLLVEVQNEHHVNVCNYILGQGLYCMFASTSKSNIVSIREQSSRRHVQEIFFARLWIRRSFETLLPPPLGSKKSERVGNGSVATEARTSFVREYDLPAPLITATN